MKLISSLFLVVVMFSTSAQATIIFEDNFDDGDTVGWSFGGLNAGLWNVGTSNSGENKLQTSATQTNYTYNGVLGLATIDNISISEHFKIETDVQVVGRNSRGNDYGHVGIAWGINGQEFNTSYLRTHWNHVTSWSRDPFSGENILAFAATNSADLDDFSYKMSVEVNFILQEMTLTIDNASTVYSGSQFQQINGNTAGGIGFINTGERVSYDNIIVRDFTVQASSPQSFVLLLLSFGTLLFLRRQK